jgi:NAD(P)-dependent dehydrogenase (short-subunit alcohol dehydrogenase family)
MPRRSPIIAITGASHGIGEAIAVAFAREMPCRLALISRNRRKIEAVARKCRKAGAEAGVFLCDVADAGAVEEMATAVRRELGGPEVLINNAGIFSGTPFLEMDVDEFDALIAANLRSVFLVSKAFVPDMVRRGRGDVYNMSSIAALRGLPGMAGYGAAKAGLAGLTRVMREELKQKGIRVAAVYPGATYTPSWEGAGIPEERMMAPADVAQAFLSIYRLSRRAVVEEIILRPQLGDL